MTDEKRSPTIVLTLVDPATLELHIGGNVPNVDVALAMLESATRIFDDRWHQAAAFAAMKQAEGQSIADSLMLKPPLRRPS